MHVRNTETNEKGQIVEVYEQSFVVMVLDEIGNSKRTAITNGLGWEPA